MSAERVIEVGMPPALRRGSATSELMKKLSEVVEFVWSELELPSKPRVAVTDRTPGSVTLDGRPVPVSARRIEQAVLAGSSVARQPGEVGTPRELLIQRLNCPDPDAAANVAACFLDVTLRAGAAGFVRAESMAIAQRLILAIGDRAPQLEVMSDAVACAADQGVIPCQLDREVDLAGDGAELGLDALSERLIRSWVDVPPRPVIEANPATLRRLTTGGRTLRSPLDFMKELFANYGVRLPAASLGVTDQPESIVRFRFGNVRTAAHLVLPDTQVVVMTPPDTLPSSSGARPFVDPAQGEVWSLVDLPVDQAWPQEYLLDPTAVVTRSLLAEMKTRLPLWAPTLTELPGFNWSRIVGERLQPDEVNGALRRLLCAQASVHLLSRLTEGIVTAAAEGTRGSAAITARLRSFLGPAVLGPLTASSDYTLIEIDRPLAREAIESESAAPLLDRHPALATRTRQFVVTCPDQWRREVECLLTPLSDIVVVLADEELASLPAAAT